MRLPKAVQRVERGTGACRIGTGVLNPFIIPHFDTLFKSGRYKVEISGRANAAGIRKTCSRNLKNLEFYQEFLSQSVTKNGIIMPKAQKDRAAYPAAEGERLIWEE